MILSKKQKLYLFIFLEKCLKMWYDSLKKKNINHARTIKTPISCSKSIILNLRFEQTLKHSNKILSKAVFEQTLPINVEALEEISGMNIWKFLNLSKSTSKSILLSKVSLMSLMFTTIKHQNFQTPVLFSVKTKANCPKLP